MNKNAAYFKYEEKIATSQLEHLSQIKTFKIGLELSELALKMLFNSFRDQYKNYPQKTVLNKFRSFLREI